MLAVGVCDLPETGGSIFVLVAGLFLLVAGVTVTRWVRQSAGRLSIVVAPLVLIGGLALVPSAADGCFNPSTDAPSLAVVGSLPAPSTPLLSNAAVVAGGSVTVTIGGFTPNEVVQLIVASNPQVIGFATANAQGFVTLTGTMPQGLAAGGHTLVAYAPVSGIGFAQPITVESTTTTTVPSATTTVPSATTTVPSATTTVPSATTTTTSTTTTTTTTTTLAPVVYQVGAAGPGGGIVIYDAGSVQSWGRYLEVACAGWSDGTCGGDDLADPRIEWCDGVVITGADGILIGTGEQNTTDITAGCPTAGIAARLANDLTLGGQDDWFLPSKDELNAFCKWAFGDTVNTVCNNSGLGGLTSGGGFRDYYWSSSEGDGLPWAQLFNSGDQVNFCGKFCTWAVRPVRAF